MESTVTIDLNERLPSSVVTNGGVREVRHLAKSAFDMLSKRKEEEVSVQQDR